MATTFSIRIEATNLRVARKEYEALGKYLEHMEDEYGKPPVAKEEKKAEAPTTKPEPKKEAPKKTKPAPKAKTKPEPKQEVKEEKKEVVEAPETVETDITHADIVALAREAVKVTGDRTKVDKVIKRYGHPISKITPNNFEAVVKDLKAMVG